MNQLSRKIGSLVFCEGSKTQHTEPQITVRRGGLMVLTQGAVDMLGDDVMHVQLGYDDNTKAIALRAVSADAKGRYLLREQRNGSTRLVDGKRFMNYNGLKFDKATRFDVETFGDGLIGFTLSPASDDKPAKEATEETPVPAKKGTSRKARKS